MLRRNRERSTAVSARLWEAIDTPATDAILEAALDRAALSSRLFVEADRRIAAAPAPAPTGRRAALVAAIKTTWQSLTWGRRSRS